MSWDQMLVHAHCSARLDNMTCRMNFPLKLDFIQVSFDLTLGAFGDERETSSVIQQPKLISWLCCLSHINNTKLLKKTTDGSGRASFLPSLFSCSVRMYVFFFNHHTNKRIDFEVLIIDITGIMCRSLCFYSVPCSLVQSQNIAFSKTDVNIFIILFSCFILQWKNNQLCAF